MLIITFHNDGTGDVLEGNYNIKVYINKTEIWNGRIEHHDRLTGWQGLIGMLASQTEDMRGGAKWTKTQSK